MPHYILSDCDKFANATGFLAKFRGYFCSNFFLQKSLILRIITFLESWRNIWLSRRCPTTSCPTATCSPTWPVTTLKLRNGRSSGTIFVGIARACVCVCFCVCFCIPNVQFCVCIRRNPNLRATQKKVCSYDVLGLLVPVFVFVSVSVYWVYTCVFVFANVVNYTHKAALEKVFRQNVCGLLVSMSVSVSFVVCFFVCARILWFPLAIFYHAEK